MDEEKRFDVVAVNLDTGVVSLISVNNDGRNAEAIVRMAVMRWGSGDEVFDRVTHGSYKEGERWEGIR